MASVALAATNSNGRGNCSHIQAVEKITSAFWQHLCALCLYDVGRHQWSPALLLFCGCAARRRYPDVIVHRLLAAALELEQQQQQPDTSDLLTAPMVDHAELPAPVDYSETVYDPAFAAAAALKDVAEMAPSSSTGKAGGGSEAGDSEDGGGSSSSDESASEAEDELEAPAATAMLRTHQLPSAKDVEAIAKHSNDTKVAARMVSDGSLKLYLCIMLRDNPVVTMAVATAVGGDRFFTAYLPELGCE